MKILKNSEFVLLADDAKAAYNAELAKAIEFAKTAKPSDLLVTVPVKSFNVGYTAKDGKDMCAITIHADEAEFNANSGLIVSGNIPNTLQLRQGMADNIARSLNLDTFEELALVAGSFTDLGSVQFTMKLCVAGTAWGSEANQVYEKTHVRTEDITYLPSEYFLEMQSEAVKAGLKAKMVAKFTGGSRTAKSKSTKPDALDMDEVNP